MAIKEKDVQYIAHLARLAIHEQDLPVYVENLGNILNLVDSMNSVNTDNITPMAHPLDIHQRLREDSVTETNQRELFQKIAPQTEAGLYLVPQVIE